MSSLGGSTNIKTQINNLWGAIRTLNNTGSGDTSSTFLPLSGGDLSGNLNLSGNEITTVSKITTHYGTLNVGYANTDNYTSTDANIVCGNGNTINDNEQIIFGNYNSILSNQTVVIGASNTNIRTGLGNVIGH